MQRVSPGNCMAMGVKLMNVKLKYFLTRSMSLVQQLDHSVTHGAKCAHHERLIQTEDAPEPSPET